VQSRVEQWSGGVQRAITSCALQRHLQQWRIMCVAV
jgi:hypothetical protein